LHLNDAALGFRTSAGLPMERQGSKHMLKQRKMPGRSRVLRLTGLTAVVGLGLSLTMGGLLVHDQRETAEQEFGRRIDLVTTAVIAETDRYIDTLTAVAAAAGSFTTLTAAKFAQVTKPVQDVQLAGATSLAFMVPSTSAQAPTVEAFWRGRGAQGLNLVPVGKAQTHIFSIFATRLIQATQASLIGTDASQAAAPNAALQLARTTGRVTVSDTYQLIADRNLPVDRRQMSFVLTAPVYATSAVDGNRIFRGWVLMGVHGQDFMGATMAGISQGLLDVQLHARNSDQTVVPVAALHAKSSDERDLHRTTQVDVANRSWQLTVQTTAMSLPGAGSALPYAATGSGLLLTLLLSALVYVLATGRARAEAEVKRATADLLEQKNMLEAIMDGVGEGIVVIDHRGEFILTNPAAAPYLKVGGRPSDDNPRDEYVELFQVDGVTPFPLSQLPTSRALAGESSHGVHILCRTPAGREMILSAGARPLDRRAGRIGAVGVFHDITADKQAANELIRSAHTLSTELALRRKTEGELLAREAELTAFAGMVAHDLKAPLRAISGFTGILRADLATAQPDGLDPACSRSMDTIVAAVGRMRSLIDDLLAYATARDRVLHQQPVDLQALVAEVITEATSHLLGDVSPELMPTIDVDPLPAVYADPVMCRQLLDNLIGNAVKYTAPGESARIRISAVPEPGQWSRIEIADRGVGIPKGKHEQLFLPFQRAHAGYTGTGLGLAICQRIVERHGGVISAGDNPGGGSRFHFTLPSATPPTTAGPGSTRTPEATFSGRS
jgi:signal transduction histidine kinase